MKKKLLSSLCALALCFTSVLGFASCGGTTGGTSEGTSEGSSGPKGMITAKPLTVEELGAGFDSNYLPDTNSIRALTGKVHVCLDFEGTQEGWKALEREYERLQGGGVDIVIDTTLAGSQYTEKLNTELTASSTDWDIVEGNLGYDNTKKKCVDMFRSIESPNPYCGENVSWSSVLEPAAYKTKEADNSGESYIMNTEVMQTCWFVNEVALEAAAEQGYENANGLPSYPVTWNDLISLCEHMEKAGYTNPLGITLCDASIESLQFTWLLRVYGDYYYRQFYPYIVEGGETDPLWANYDPAVTVPENLAGFKVQYSKILAILFMKENNPLECGYNGFESALYRDFVGNLAKMKGHLIKDVTVVEFGQLRDKFLTQSEGMSAPQILLDYQGFGINYAQSSSENFTLGYFDYPVMESRYVPEETLTRDIGGNGGFLSVVNHLNDSAQNELNKDFVKFVLSPYGQTIYYKGLAEAGKVPKGLSTVKNELVVIPSAWVEFFNESNQTIKFNGDVDANNFLSWGVRYTCGYPQGQKAIKELWRKLLLANLSNPYTVQAFASEWAMACETDAKAMTVDYGWNSKVWEDAYYVV